MKFTKFFAGAAALIIAGTFLSGQHTVPRYSSVSAADESFTEGVSGTLSYKNYGSYAVISDCDESVSEVTVPDYIDGIPVTEIGSRAFSNCLALTSVKLPETLTAIGDYAFSKCISLPSVTIPAATKKIGDYAFTGCSKLGTLNIPENLTDFGHKSFNDTAWLNARRSESPFVTVNNILIDGLTCTNEITIPDGITAIGTGAFYDNSSISRVVIPDSVTSVGSKAFQFCERLAEIKIPSGISEIGMDAFSDTQWINNQQKISPFVIVNGILIDGKECSGSITIPDNVTKIADGAFMGCQSLVSVNIPASVRSIGECVFVFCSKLVSAEISENTESIGRRAFYWCMNLESVTINNPDCVIYDSLDTFQNDFCNSGSEFFSGTIYGIENSTAQAYADKYCCFFGVTGAGNVPEMVCGDADGDEKTGISDVVAVMSYAKNKAVYPLSYEALKRADVFKRGDGVTIADALSIRKKLAQKIEKLPESHLY